MFEHNGKNYVLKFNIGRLKMIENAAGGKSSMSMMLADNSGLMSITATEAFFSYGLKEMVPTLSPPLIRQKKFAMNLSKKKDTLLSLE